MEKLKHVHVPADLESLPAAELVALVRSLSDLNRELVSMFDTATNAYRDLAVTVGEGITSVMESAVTGFATLDATVADVLPVGGPGGE